jgi:hypothetical protein
MVVISVGTVMVAVAVGLIHGLLRLEHFVRDDFRWRMDCDRLAAQFREDCHAARQQRLSGASPTPNFPATPSATAGASGAVARNSCQFLVTPDHAIEYRIEPERLVREERSSGKVLQRESYLLPPGMCASLELQGESGTGLQPVILSRPGLQPVKSGDSLETRPTSAGLAGDLPGGSATRPARFAVLRIIPRGNVPRDPRAQPLRIEAALGTDHRFQQGKGT